MRQEHPVSIIGGGWAGLAAAIELTLHGIPVALFESAPQLGGRARNAPFAEHTVDNGQHLLIGAYNETLRLLCGVLGADEQELFMRTSLRLKVVEGNDALALQAPPLPAPVHLAWALLFAEGLTLGERLQALNMCLKLLLSDFSVSPDISVARLLQHHKQGKTVIRRLWEPLCIATLNTPIEQASAQVFLRVLKDSFSRRRHDADLLIPKEALGSLFPLRAAGFLQQHGARVYTRRRVEGLQLRGQELVALRVGGEEYACRDAIVATAPRAAVRLLTPHEPLRPLAGQIAALGSQPIVTVYLQYPGSHRLDTPLIGMSGMLSQWLFDRAPCGQHGLIAVVISADGEHIHWDNEKLTLHVTQELAAQFPQWPEASSALVIREKNATFDCSVGIEQRRPENSTGIQGLWLAGDYTDTGYPATLEGAVRSGIECARRIIEQRSV